MTVRPIFPEGRRKHVRVAVALCIVMVAVLLAVGCIGGDYIRDEDITVIKVHHDGAMEWMKTIDTGKNDFATNIIQTPDGEYTISGGYTAPLCNSQGPATPIVFHLADNGNILWKKEYTLGPSDGVMQSPDQIAGIVQNSVNGYYLISRYGVLVNLDSSGNPVWKKNLSSGESDTFDISYPPHRTSDGSILVGGSVWQCLRPTETAGCGTGTRDYRPFVVKLDREGNQSWFTKFSSKNFWNVISINELSEKRGYIGQGQNNTGTRPLFFLDGNGVISNYSSIDSIDNLYHIQAVPGGFSGFSIDQNQNNTLEGRVYTENGKLSRIVLLENLTVEGPYGDYGATIATREGDYFSVKTNRSYYSRPVTTTVHALKFDSDGKQLWDHQVTTFTVGGNSINFRDLIETTDGGYLMVLGVTKVRAC
jgi:hypothetical protein